MYRRVIQGVICNICNNNNNNNKWKFDRIEFLRIFFETSNKIKKKIDYWKLLKKKYLAAEKSIILDGFINRNLTHFNSIITTTTTTTTTAAKYLFLTRCTSHGFYRKYQRYSIHQDKTSAWFIYRSILSYFHVKNVHHKRSCHGCGLL